MLCTFLPRCPDEATREFRASQLDFTGLLWDLAGKLRVALDIEGLLTAMTGLQKTGLMRFWSLGVSVVTPTARARNPTN